MLTYNFEGLLETLDLSMREIRMDVQREAKDVLSKLCEELSADQHGPFQILKFATLLQLIQFAAFFCNFFVAYKILEIATFFATFAFFG